jgi:hypothetical protein
MVYGNSLISGMTAATPRFAKRPWPDHLGDMDFKVAGSEAGITALQMDIKIDGITSEIMHAAPRFAKRPWPISRRFGEPTKPVSPTLYGGKL